MDQGTLTYACAYIPDCLQGLSTLLGGGLSLSIPIPKAKFPTLGTVLFLHFHPSHSVRFLRPSQSNRPYPTMHHSSPSCILDGARTMSEYTIWPSGMHCLHRSCGHHVMIMQPSAPMPLVGSLLSWWDLGPEGPTPLFQPIFIFLHANTPLMLPVVIHMPVLILTQRQLYAPCPGLHPLSHPL